MVSTRNQIELSDEALKTEDLASVTGGIAPLLIGVGIAAGIGGGFAGGYALSRVFG